MLHRNCAARLTVHTMLRHAKNPKPSVASSFSGKLLAYLSNYKVGEIFQWNTSGTALMGDLHFHAVVAREKAEEVIIKL